MSRRLQRSAVTGLGAGLLILSVGCSMLWSLSIKSTLDAKRDRVDAVTDLWEVAFALMTLELPENGPTPEAWNRFQDSYQVLKEQGDPAILPDLDRARIDESVQLLAQAHDVMARQDPGRAALRFRHERKRLLAELRGSIQRLRALNRASDDQIAARWPIFCGGLAAAWLMLVLLTAIGMRHYVDLQALRRSEATLREGEERLREIFDNAMDVIQCVGLDGSIQYANRAWRELLGYDNPTGLKIQEIFDSGPTTGAVPSPGERAWGHVAQGLCQGAFRTRDGRTVHVEGSTAPIFRGGRIVGARSILRDVTGKLETLELLRAGEEKYRRIFDDNPLPIITWDRDGNVLDWNRRAEIVFERTRDDTVGRPLIDFTPEDPEIRRDIRAVMERLIRGESPIVNTQAAVTRGGRLLMCEWWNTVLHDRDGQASVTLSLALDVTEKHRAEAALRYSEATQSALLAAIPDLMFRIRADGTYLDYNAPRVDMFYRPETFLGRKVREILPEAIARRTEAAIAQALATGQCQTINYEHPINGERRFWEARIAMSSPTEVVSLVRDITEWILVARQREDAVEKLRGEVAVRHRAELEAKRSHDLVEMIRRAQASFITDEPLSKVFDQLLGGLLTQTESTLGLIGEVRRDPDGTMQLVPRAISEMTWHDANPFSHERNRRGGFDAIGLDTLFGQVAVTGRTVLCNEPADEPRHDGLPPIRSFLGLPFYHRDELLGMVGVANREGGYDEALIQALQPLLTTCASLIQAHRNDLERQRMEIELQASKEAAETANRSKDHFLAVLSHELRTPLTPVLAAATALLDDPTLAAEVVPAMEMIRRNIQLESRLIDDLLDVSRIGRGTLSLHSEIVDLHALIAHALEVCEAELKSGGLTLRQALQAAHYHVKGDPARLQQAVWNLVKNAVKFTPSGGTITVRSAGRDGRIELAVEDTGVGIPPSDLDRIFVAFEQGRAGLGRPQGLGLGLAITRSIIEAHDGTIRVVSTGPNRGATFTIELATVPVPRIAATSRPHPKTVPPGPDRADARPLEGVRILLVEDNRDTLRFFSWILDRAGGSVTAAVSVADGVRALEGGDFHLVVSDIELPDGSGTHFMREHCAPRGIQAIAMSGFGSDEDVRQSLDAGFVRHLTKPLDSATLIRAVRQACTPREDVDPCQPSPRDGTLTHADRSSRSRTD